MALQGTKVTQQPASSQMALIASFIDLVVLGPLNVHSSQSLLESQLCCRLRIVHGTIVKRIESCQNAESCDASKGGLEEVYLKDCIALRCPEAARRVFSSNIHCPIVGIINQ